MLFARQNTLKKISWVVLFLCLWSSRIHATEPELITDRPDQTESAHTVPPWLFQIELGAAYGESQDGSEKTVLQSIPQALVRIGLSRRFEIRLGIPGLEETGLRAMCPTTMVAVVGYFV